MDIGIVIGLVGLWFSSVLGILGLWAKLSRQWTSDRRRIYEHINEELAKRSLVVLCNERHRSAEQVVCSLREDIRRLTDAIERLRIHVNNRRYGPD